MLEELDVASYSSSYVCLCACEGARERKKGGGGEEREAREQAGRQVSVETFRPAFRNDRRAGLPGNNICTACM